VKFGGTEEELSFASRINQTPSGGTGTMGKQENRKVVEEFYDIVFRHHDLGAVDRFIHDDYIQHNPDVAQGKIGFVEFHKGFFRAFPDSCASINRLVAEGDFIFVYNTITATHTGEGFLDYPPTGNKVRYDVVDMFRLRDGKLAEHWDVADTRALFSQVGAFREVAK
jgi:predicted SnoaL-like aldol condensation-catalyzing enzyme